MIWINGRLRDSWQYGVVHTGGGGSTVQAPPVDPKQQELESVQADLLRQQKDILSQQYSDQKLLAPYLYKQLGITPQYDAQGNITGYQDTPADATSQQITDLQKSITLQNLQQEQQALQGNAPVDPSVQRQLDQSEQSLRSGLQANLGPGYETSTPGVRALLDFNQRKNEILYSTKRGQMTLSDALAQSAQAGYQGNEGAQLARTMGVFSLPSQISGQFGQLAAGYGAAQQPFEQQSQFGLQAGMATAQARAAAQAGQGALFGAGIGGTAMVAAAAIM
jgi:hypothetical protein